jgi:Uma2 family endonuclease
MAVAESIHKLTEAEYLDLERKAEFKSEFFDGEMFAMAGGTPMHSLIATNLAREFGNKLQGSRCVPFNRDLRLKAEATGLFTYPDLSIICGPLEFADDAQDTVINPTVIVEVLSDSTEAYDRGKKFEHYRRIPSLREYLLVSQSEPHVEQFIHDDAGQWLLREAAGLDASLGLSSLQVMVALREIYANVTFAPPVLRPPTPRRA